MRQWQDASLASNAAMEREREQREELEIRFQELTRREEDLRHEMEDSMRQERERYRAGVETMRGQLQTEQDERRRQEQVASQATERERRLRQTDPADLIFDVLGARPEHPLAHSLNDGCLASWFCTVGGFTGALCRFVHRYEQGWPADQS